MLDFIANSSTIIPTQRKRNASGCMTTEALKNDTRVSLLLLQIHMHQQWHEHLWTGGSLFSLWALKNGKINMLWLNDAETLNCHRDERLNLRLTVTKSILCVRGMTGLMYGNMYFNSTIF